MSKLLPTLAQGRPSLWYFPRMLVRRVATAALAGLLFSPALARAQSFTATPTGTVAAGYSASETIPDAPTSNPTVLLGPFVSFGPSLALLYETPRTTQSLQTAFTLALPLSNNFLFDGRPLAYSGRAAYANRIELTELTNLSLSFAVSAVPVNSYVNGVDASSTPLEASPNDSAYNLSLNGLESLTRELSPDSRIVQLANVTYNYPFNVDPIRSTTLNIYNTLSLSREWAQDTGTIALSVGYTRFGPGEEVASQAGSDGVATLTQVTDPRDDFINSLIATWQRPLTPLLTSSVDLGVLQVLSPESTTGPIWQPTGGASLAYSLEFATASVSYTHGAQPNVFSATINLNDQVALRAALPIGVTGFALGSSVGYTYSRPINTDGTIASGLNLFLADIELGYVPLALPKLSVGVRGSYNRQTSVDDANAGLTRLSLIANLAFSFPSAQAATISRRIAPAYTPTPVLGSDTRPSAGVPLKPIDTDTREAPAAPATPGVPARP